MRAETKKQKEQRLKRELLRLQRQYSELKALRLSLNKLLIRARKEVRADDPNCYERELDHRTSTELARDYCLDAINRTENRINRALFRLNHLRENP